MSEKAFINWIRKRLVPAEHVVVHSGDDLAVLKGAGGSLTAFGIDTIIAGVDFAGPDAECPTPARKVGRKALAVNLSDIAAMGAKPMACVASVILPPGLDTAYAQDLYEGLTSEAVQWDMPVVGGDVSASEAPLSLTVAILGSYDNNDRPLLRRAAGPGDSLFVTGALGGSILGRHLDFEPRVKVGRLLAASGIRVACIDISDGLSVDAAHLAEESRARVVIETKKIPISEAAERLSAQDNRPALEHALHDGEDFELLFTLPSEDADALLAHWPEGEQHPHLIGRVEDPADGQEGKVYLETGNGPVPLEQKGYEHRF